MLDRRIKVGCIGGGQLGRMLALEAPRLNIDMMFLDPKGQDCPAAGLSRRATIQGDFKNTASIVELSKNCDILTVEIEHVCVETLADLEEKGVNVQPSSGILRIIQDKLLQKQHFASKGVPIGPFSHIPSVESIRDTAAKFGLPLMIKSRRGAYDGRGNAVLKSIEAEAINEALSKLGYNNNYDAKEAFDLYAEGWIDFKVEVAVMVVRSSNQEASTTSYPPVNAIQQDSICRVVLAPARDLSSEIYQECKRVAQVGVDSLGAGASGMFGVELFITKDNKVLLNEIAPRPHNTGHYTQDACTVSQFENHLRGICGLPLGSTEMIVGAAAMVNVLGSQTGTIVDTMKSSVEALSLPRAVVHWYGKIGCKPGRKMGHINITANSHSEIDENLSTLLALEGIPISLLPNQMNHVPLVGVIMGSQSDLPTMHAAVDILRQFNIPHEVDIVSAHRTPDKLVQYARGAVDRGLRVIIAGAGGAAHLPGMVASMTQVPVIGVPVKTSTLSGVDSLYSIVQMPRGIPVATVAIGNAQNAGLLAVRILSTSRAELRKKLLEHQLGMTDMVHSMSSKLNDLGPDKILAEMGSENKSVNV